MIGEGNGVISASAARAGDDMAEDGEREPRGVTEVERIAFTLGVLTGRLDKDGDRDDDRRGGSTYEVLG